VADYLAEIDGLTGLRDATLPLPQFGRGTTRERGVRPELRPELRPTEPCHPSRRSSRHLQGNPRAGTRFLYRVAGSFALWGEYIVCLSARGRLTAAAVLASSLSLTAARAVPPEARRRTWCRAVPRRWSSSPTAAASSQRHGRARCELHAGVSSSRRHGHGDRRRQAVKFPTTVTDAAFSQDGSRVAFVDADGTWTSPGRTARRGSS